MRSVTLFFLLAGLWVSSLGATGRLPQIHLAGDSTMAPYAPESALRGWGMALGAFFDDASRVRNHAVSGRSTKSFRARGTWDKLLAEVHPGDFVLIQFGHNDEKVEQPQTGTDVATEFPENLRRMVREVRGKGATPLLATPVARRKFDAAGRLVPTHGAYPDAVRTVARELDVPLLDLERATSAWLQEAGVEPSQAFFMGLRPVGNPPAPPKTPDNTHFIEAGAEHVAALAVAEIRALNLPLVRWLKPSLAP